MSFQEGYDLINLNDLVKYFNRFYKAHLKTRTNLLGKEDFLYRFLNGLSVGENTKYGPDVLLTAFKKVMSGNHPSSQVVSACFGKVLEQEQQKQKERMPMFLTNIERFRKNAIEGVSVYTAYVESVYSDADIEKLFSELLTMCRVPHFSENELERLRTWADAKSYRELFHAIMFHAFSCAHYNQPYMYTERLYQEALPQQASYWSLAYELETSWKKFDDKMLKAVRDKLKKDVFEYVEQLHDTTMKQQLTMAGYRRQKLLRSTIWRRKIGQMRRRFAA